MEPSFKFYYTDNTLSSTIVYLNNKLFNKK